MYLPLPLTLFFPLFLSPIGPFLYTVHFPQPWLKGYKETLRVSVYMHSLFTVCHINTHIHTGRQIIELTLLVLISNPNHVQF